MAKILIIDDSEHPLDLVKDFLQEHGFTVNIVSVEKVIHHYIDDHDPDIILLDVVTERNSRDICSELKSNQDLKRVPIILMSTDYNKLENYEECMADDVIKKPFILPEVIAKIKSVLEVYNFKSSSR